MFLFYNNYLRVFILVAVFSLFMGMTPLSKASEIFLSGPPITEVSVKQDLTIDVWLNTEGESINAVEGKLNFPIDILTFKEIRNGDSIVNYWIEQPKLETAGQIVYAGVIAGGFNGDKGRLLAVVFTPKTIGQGRIFMDQAKALLNDGEGTESELKLLDYQISISNELVTEPVFGKPVDYYPPEPFEPIVTSDPNLADGKLVVVFAAQDKESGIDYYEVKEGDRPFTKAVSPYVLQDQTAGKVIIVRAVDKAGNRREAYIPKSESKDDLKQKEKRLFEGIFVSVGLAVLLLAVMTWRKVLK